MCRLRWRRCRRRRRPCLPPAPPGWTPGRWLGRTEMPGSRASEFWLCHRPFGDDSDAVRMVDEARAAVVRDTAERASAAGFGRVRVFSTADIEGLDVEKTQPKQLIGDIISTAALGIDVPVCYGGGGMPTMMAADWEQVLEAISDGGAVSNRMFSCDWVGSPRGRLLASVAGESVDNRFALRLRNDSGVDVRQFARSARSLLDLDTPTDLVVLSVAGEVGSLQIGPALARVIEEWRTLLSPSVERAVEVFEVMTRRDAELMTVGRISGADWAVVDRDTSCRVRVVSEERGLRVRGARARSLLGALFESLGCERFVSALGEVADGVIWDTRPFFSHLGWEVSRLDRFWADLGRPDEISFQPLAELVSALEGQPVLIGGHSLVSGGMLAAIDAAWTQRELSG